MGVRRNVLITGASSGLGEGMARLFAADGRNLALCARRIDNLERIAAELRAAHPEIRVVVRQLDVNDHDAVFRVFADCDAELGGLDRVIANAGLGKGQPIGTGNFRANKQTAETNFIGLLAQCEAAMEIFRRRNAGHLVVVSSMSAMRGMKGNVTTYAASKAAAAHLAEGIRPSVANEPMMTAQNKGKQPMLTGAAAGHKAMVAAIEKEPDNACVPWWPWTPMSKLLQASPTALLRRLT